MSARPAIGALSRSEALRIWALALGLSALGFWLAWRTVGPPPPRSLTLASGFPGGGYDRMARDFRTDLAEDGIAVTIRETAGSVENLELLREGRVDLALVQGGVASEEDFEHLTGIAALSFEPLFIASRMPFTRLEELRGARVQLGAPGSGTLALVSDLLAATGFALEDFGEVRRDPIEEALASLESGAVDALFLVGEARSEPIRRLFSAGPPIAVRDLARDHGIRRHLAFLEVVELTAGSVDLLANQPAESIELLAPAATLIGREGLHSSVVSLAIESAKKRFSSRGVLREAGEFPNLEFLEIPPTKAARRAMLEGPSFLYRVFPFQVAAVLDRMKILMLPLITLLFPLIRMAPPLYRWRIRRRILIWYRRIIDLEHRLHSEQVTPEVLRQAALELDRFDAELASTEVPMSYADELFHLRAHLRLVREDLNSGRGRWS